MIADLTTLGLDKEAQEARAHSIGGSDANTILSGDEAKLLALWEKKTGRRDEDDLKDKLYAVMGQFTEPLNAAWFQLQTGLIVTDRQQHLTCDLDDWRTATLDGRIGPDAVFEAKHSNPFLKVDETLRQYLPQLHHNMDVAHAKRAYLSVFRGNADWVYWAIDYDPDYGHALHQAEWNFWMSVLADEPPVPYPVPPDPTALAVKVVSFEGDNRWADMAATFLETRRAHKRCEDAKDGLKKLIEPDVKRAFGHGVEFNRDKRGALRIAAMEE